MAKVAVINEQIRQVLRDDFQFEPITLEIEISEDYGYIDCV